jgi:hypothetical protein
VSGAAVHDEYGEADVSRNWNAQPPVRPARSGLGSSKARLGVALSGTIATLLLTVLIASDEVGGSDSLTSSAPQPPFADNPAPPREGGGQSPSSGDTAPPPEDGVPTHNLPQGHEKLPCTGLKDPINFEIFSAGPSPAGLTLTGSGRRCDAGVPADEWPSNYVSYAYGDCQIPENATGCQRPLEIQSWPACQRSIADYTFEGKPLPYRKLPRYGGAEVVELDFAIESRIEVYTKSATIVIFATDRELGREAVRLLRPQEKGRPPAMGPDSLGGRLPDGLDAPRDGSMEGVLPCQS